MHGIDQLGQLLAYADGVNLLGGNIDTIKKNTETLIEVSKGVGLEINVERSKCYLVTRMQVEIGTKNSKQIV
jgi:hypothetical protein